MRRPMLRFMMPARSGGDFMRLPFLVRACFLLGCSVRSAAFARAKRFHSRSGEVRSSAAIPAAGCATRRSRRRPHGLVRRFHHPSQNAGRIQSRSSHSSLPRKCHRDLGHSQSRDGRSVRCQQDDELRRRQLCLPRPQRAPLRDGVRGNRDPDPRQSPAKFNYINPADDPTPKK